MRRTKDTDYPGFRSIPRWSRDIIITEKIDGTNGLIHIDEDGVVRAGSKNRWLTPEDDNYGFAAWVREMSNALRSLGTGYHYGEWWGRGIQRGYGMNERKFNLFNVDRYSKLLPSQTEIVDVVPILYRGPMRQGQIDMIGFTMNNLSRNSVAAPGFTDPEGIVIYHTSSRQSYKKTFKDDEKGKDVQV